MADVIVLDSSDDEDKRGKRKIAEPPARKRIKPQLISKEVTIKQVMKGGLATTTMTAADEEQETLMEVETRGSKIIYNSTVTRLPEVEIIKVGATEPQPGSSSERSANESPAGQVDRNKINDDFTELMKVCREAESSPDMDRLITNRLLKYYQSAHPDFVNSKSFCRSVRQTTQAIRNNPSLVYFTLQSIVDELNIRRKSGNAIVTDADSEQPSTGDKRTDRKLKKLNQALVRCTKKITELEEADVNFDDEVNSAHIMAERFKERACKIYEKICDLTGESRHANRTVRKPIKFGDTSYIEFNKAVQTFCNKTLKFPDFLDILKILQYCNTQFDYGLRVDDQRRIAQGAFQSLGRLLQKRRKIDLYETVEHFTNHQRDPAMNDPQLRSKLEENKRQYSRRIDDIIDKYARDPKSSDDETEPSVNPLQQKPSETPSPLIVKPENGERRASSTKSGDLLNNNETPAPETEQFVKMEPELDLGSELFDS